MTPSIRLVQPTTGTLVDTTYDPADYRDAFLVPLEQGAFESVGDFASAYFLQQPRWLSLLSMNLISNDKRVAAIGDAKYDEGSSVGSWKVYRRNDEEIVFGDDMGFMAYRFSFLKRDDGDIEASTAVKYRWGRVSRVYFGLVKPLHRKFVPLSLRGALRGSGKVSA